MSDQVIPDALQHRIATAKPQTMVGHALRWAATRGLYVFPAERFLGTPLVPGWYRKATLSPDTIVEWWSEHPDADIAAVPSKSQYWVMIADGVIGRRSFYALEAEYGEIVPAFFYMNCWNCWHLWFAGRRPPGQRLGRGLRIVEEGDYVYLSPSVAPTRRWTGQQEEED